MKSGISADAAVNTFYCESATELTDDEANNAALDFAHFYNVAPAAGVAMGTYFASCVAQNGHTTKLYNLDEPLPRVPVASTTFNLAADPAGASLPAECAIALSYSADVASGTNPARRRGRFSFGPLDQSAMSADTQGRMVVHPTFIARAILSLQKLGDDLAA